MRFAILSGVGKLVSHSWASLFEYVCIRTPNENSLLTLEAPEKRESESSEPIFRTHGCNLEGCVRETEISLQTESAADWARGTRKALETREKLGRNEKTPGYRSLDAGALSLLVAKVRTLTKAPRTERSLQSVSERLLKKCLLGNGFRLFVFASVGRLSEQDEHERFWASVNRRMVTGGFSSL